MAEKAISRLPCVRVYYDVPDPAAMPAHSNELLLSLAYLEVLYVYGSGKTKEREKQNFRGFLNGGGRLWHC